MNVNNRTQTITMSEVTDPAEIAKMHELHRKFQRNIDWLDAHATEVFSHRGKFICIAGQELFVAETFDEVNAWAKVTHPEDDGRFIKYIPESRAPRIYAS